MTSCLFSAYFDLAQMRHLGRHDIQHNDTQHNDTQYSGLNWYNKQNDTQHNDN